MGSRLTRCHRAVPGPQIRDLQAPRGHPWSRQEANRPTCWLICLEEGTGRLERLRRYTGLKSERCIRKDQTGLQKNLSKRRRILMMLQTKQQGEVRSENTPGEKTEVKETEKSLVETKEKEPVQDTEMSKKKSEAKKEKTSSSSVSPKEVEIEKEVKAKLFDPMKAKEEGRSKEKKTRAAEDGFVERKSVRDRSKEEKKLLEANESNGKT